jgi:hypothetical protein
MSLLDKQAIVKDLPSVGLISTSFVPCAQDFVGGKSLAKYCETDEARHLIQKWTEEIPADTVNNSEWSKREGFGGPRCDADALAMAIAKVKKLTDPAPFAKRIAEEKGYAAMALKVPAVLAHYNEITGKSATVGDL